MFWTVRPIFRRESSTSEIDWFNTDLYIILYCIYIDLSVLKMDYNEPIILQAFKIALAQIRICSRLEALLLKKKNLSNGDSPEIHAQKVQLFPLWVLQEVLLRMWVLGLTQSQKLPYRVKIASHLYILKSLDFSQYTSSRPTLWAWCVETWWVACINGSRIGLDTINESVREYRKVIWGENADIIQPKQKLITLKFI